MLFMRYFNPRSREGSDPTAVFLLHFPSISIHAPARGATAGITATQNLSQDFNPRSREGSDTVCSPFVISSQYFNPRSREGSDLPSWCIWSMASIISIHAPARGATPPGYTECTTTGNFNPRSREGSDDLPDRQPAERDDFNPRSREGSDVIQFVLQAEFIKFQSTLPRGERLPLDSVCFKYLLFQSTLPRGERQKLQYISTRTIAIFQSTLPRGERLETQKTSGSQSEISIHAPARGATYSPHEIKERLQINFNPRSREGSDRQPSEHWRFRQAFQSTLPRGERRGVGGTLIIQDNFNPRSREGSDLSESHADLQPLQFQSTLPRGERPKEQTITTYYRNFNPRSREGSDSART